MQKKIIQKYENASERIENNVFVDNIIRAFSRE